MFSEVVEPKERTKRRPYPYYSSPNVAKVCFHSSHASSSPSSGSSAYANAFRCSNVHDDLLTCFFIRGVPGYLFSHNPQDQNTPHTHVVHPQFSHLLTKPQPSVSLSATRYAKDPVFNIVLPKRSPSTILSTGEMPD